MHWVVLDLPLDAAGLPGATVPAGAVQARNSAGRPSYFGPCPPSGTHHYRFTVYALSRRTGLRDGVDLDTALRAVQSAARAKGRLVGTYAPALRATAPSTARRSRSPWLGHAAACWQASLRPCRAVRRRVPAARRLESPRSLPGFTLRKDREAPMSTFEPRGRWGAGRLLVCGLGCGGAADPAVAGCGYSVASEEESLRRAALPWS